MVDLTSAAKAPQATPVKEKKKLHRAKQKKPLRPGRYAAKLLFQFRVSVDGQTKRRRICEERIIIFRASYAQAALQEAKRRGRAAQHSYKNIHGDAVCFQFVGVLELLHLDACCDPDEVWYDITERVRPMERRASIIPPAKRLCAIRNSE